MTRLLTKHQDIRRWAEARSGSPALSEVPHGTHSHTVLRLVFDQRLMNSGENDNADRPNALELVGWDDWLAEFDKQKLALKVDDEAPGLLDSDHEFVARP